MPKLAGKRVATTAGTGLQYFLVRALAKHGMTLKDVEFVNLPVGDAQAAFLAGRVDAVVPSLTGRYYVRTLRKDTRELFTHDAFTRPPGPDHAVRGLRRVRRAASVVQSGRRRRCARSSSVYHGKAVPFLRNPATQADAIARHHALRQHRAEEPDGRGRDARAARAERLLRRARSRTDHAQRRFRAGLEDQVSFLDRHHAAHRHASRSTA